MASQLKTPAQIAAIIVEMRPKRESSYPVNKDLIQARKAHEDRQFESLVQDIESGDTVVYPKFDKDYFKNRR